MGGCIAPWGRALVMLSLGLTLAACARRLPEVNGEVMLSEDSVVYVARKVRTMDPSLPIAEAFAVERGKVVAVGRKDALLQAARGKARVVDLGDAVVVPGLSDAHAHLAGLGRALTVLSLRGTRSLEEVVARAKAAPAASYQGDWLVGRGWDQNDWPQAQRAFPHRKRLDALFPDTPVFLTRVDGHAAWVNGEALRRAGLHRETKDPVGGRLLKDEHGELTGVLVDNAIDLVQAKLPPLTQEQRAERLVAALRRCLEVGLTSVHDAGMDLETFTLLQQWDAGSRLPLRVYAMADGQGKDAEEFLGRGPFHGRKLTMRSVKFLLDGALGSRGAALFTPYSDDPHHSGLLLLTPEDYEQRVRAFIARGFQVNTHAIGDRANALVLDIVSRASKAEGQKDARHRLEHAQVLRREDILRVAALGMVASMQPTHATSDMPWAEARLGPARLGGAYAWRSLKDAGVTLAFGSDFPVEEPPPLWGLYAARTRTNGEGKPEGGWQPQERLTAEEALEAFTVGPAFAAFAEDRRGRLSSGMDADFVVFDVDPVEDAPSALLRGRVLSTYVAGEEVYRAEGP